MTTEPIGTPQAPSNPEQDEQGVASRTEAKLDELAQRFDRSDWIELGAAVLLALVRCSTTRISCDGSRSSKYGQ